MVAVHTPLVAVIFHRCPLAVAPFLAIRFLGESVGNAYHFS